MIIIAYYLPQYHPTEDNNKWWGEGFTEWTNVAKAKPLFRGHYQPKIPADLGFYDLRMSDIRKKQADLAKEAGVSGFCYYHYWFGNGRQELELPFNEVVSSGEPDFPFCLCWANETWSRKFWNKDGNVIDSETLIEQEYLGKDDDILHFNTLLPAFKDKRYIRIDGKLVFVVYKPLAFQNISNFIITWNSLAKENGLNGFYFIGFTFNADKEGEQILQLGFDGIDSCRLNRNRIRNFSWFFRKSISVIFRTPRRIAYKKIMPTFIGKLERDYDNYFPTIIPNWDHTPRSGVNGDLLTNSSPNLFELHCMDVLSMINKKKKDRQICFLKSWNEWGEGNYMEPDLKYGKGFIHALKKAMDAVK
jgi:hypothetical protein